MSGVADPREPATQGSVAGSGAEQGNPRSDPLSDRHVADPWQAVTARHAATGPLGPWQRGMARGDGAPDEAPDGPPDDPDDRCQVCHRTPIPAGLTCPSCVGLARDNLRELAWLIAALPGQAVNGRQALHTHEGIPGGDATVMLTPASVYRDPGELSVVRGGDPRPPLDVLAFWTEAWRGQTGHGPVVLGYAGTLAYLDRQLHLIAATPVFAVLARDLARLRHQVENVVHAGDRADVSRVPCWDCGARLVKVWADKATRDHWRCPVCGEVYDQGRYERAQHDHLASQGAERFVPLMDAVAATGRPEQTVRTWVRTGLVEQRRQGSGRVEVWWPDVRDRHRVTPLRRRSGG